MSWIERRIPHRSQPQGAVPLRIPAFEFFNPGAGMTSLGRHVVGGATVFCGISDVGRTCIFTGGGESFIDIPYRKPFANEWTVVALVRSTVAGGAQFVVNQNYNGTSVPISLSCGGTASGGAFDGAAVFNGDWRKSGVATDIRGDNKWHVVAGRASGATERGRLEYWLDGRLDSSAACGGNIPVDNINNISIGMYKNDVATLRGELAGVLIADGWLDDAMMVALGGNFWDALVPRTGRIWTPDAAPSGVPDITAVLAESILSDRVSYRATLNYA